MRLQVADVLHRLLWFDLILRTIAGFASCPVVLIRLRRKSLAVMFSQDSDEW